LSKQDETRHYILPWRSQSHFYTAEIPDTKADFLDLCLTCKILLVTFWLSQKTIGGEYYWLKSRRVEENMAPITLNC